MFIKKLTVLMTAALLCCAPALADEATAVAPDGGEFIAVEDYPVMDGSTATLPLSYALMQAFTGCTEDEAHAAIRHSKTTNSFYQLSDGTSDLLLVYQPGQSALDYIDETGVNYSMEPIGRDALVFLVNAANPVTNLTQAEVTGIYAGEITDWGAIEGGTDSAITAYQRPEASGSQVMMRNLAMGDVEMAAAPEAQTVGEMGELIDAIADYDNAENSLGYSVYYYAANMYQVDTVKLLSIDGAEPNIANIESGAYPYVQPFYAVIRESSGAGSPERRLFDFLLSDGGQDFVRACGYAGAGAGTETGE